MPKVKRTGEVISWKEFFKRWKQGITNLTPKQKISNERNATVISLIGFIISLVVMVIFREQFFISWFAYGLIVVFIGSIYSNFIKLLSLNQMLKTLKDQETNSINIDDIINKVNHALDENPETSLIVEGKETKGMSTQGIKIEKYTEKVKNEIK